MTLSHKRIEFSESSPWFNSLNLNYQIYIKVQNHHRLCCLLILCMKEISIKQKVGSGEKDLLLFGIKFIANMPEYIDLTLITLYLNDDYYLTGHIFILMKSNLSICFTIDYF